MNLSSEAESLAVFRANKKTGTERSLGGRAEGEIEILTKHFGLSSQNSGEPLEDLNRK